MFNFASHQQLALALFVSVVNAFVLCLCSQKLLHMFQLGGYKVRNYVKWVGDRRSRFYIRLFVLTVLSLGSMLVVNILFDSFEIVYLSYLGLIFYFYLCAVFILNTYQTPAKVPLKFTPRVRRLVALLFLVYFFVTLTIIWVGSTTLADVRFIRFSMVALIPMFLPFIILICHYLLYPIEESIKAGYVAKARRKLRAPEFANLIRIGITGSWGKTSCKNILAMMLREKYAVAASPQSFNTPMGLTKTINNILQAGDEILIFEMGARYPNDIKQLCKMFHPTHGILTSIGPQHLETFRSLDNIKRAKSDLIRALPENGIAVLNGDNEKCREVAGAREFKNRKGIRLSKIDECVDKISVTSDGCEFELKLQGEEPIICKTKLLGKHNIENILMCAMVASGLGLSTEQIAAAIAKLEPTPHRLELIKAANGVLILDDSYNASPNGTIAALGVLSLFKGKKVVMTPGLVELGPRETEENFKFGARIAAVADKAIIVNDIHRTAITDGLLESGFKPENIICVKSLDEAKGLYSSLLAEGDVLLIENDLPDNYM